MFDCFDLNDIDERFESEDETDEEMYEGELTMNNEEILDDEECMWIYEEELTASDEETDDDEDI